MCGQFETVRESGWRRRIEMMSSDERISSPMLPKDSDPGSSVSSDLQDEYEELLRYAVVTPKWDSGALKQPHYVTKLATGSKDSSTIKGTISEKRHENPVRQKTADTVMTPDKLDSATVEKPPEEQEVPHRTPISFLSNTGLAVGPLDFSERLPSHLPVSRKPEMSNPVCQLPIPAENLDRVENILNTASDHLKADVLSEIRQWRLSVIEQHKQELQDERMKHEAQIAQMACQTENLNQLICTYEDSVRRKDEVITNLIQGIQNLKEKIELMRRFTQWRLQHSEAKMEAYANTLADRHYRFCLMKKVCTAWKSEMQTEWKERVEKACQARAEEVCIQLSRDYERRLDASKEELEGARAEIRRLSAEKDKYTDSMKKAFMRGVCALNLEAMSMFQNGNRRVEHGESESMHRRDDPDHSSVSVSQAAGSLVAPIPAASDSSIPFESDRMVTLHFGSTNVAQTRPAEASTPPAAGTVASSALGFQTAQKLPPAKCVTSTQQNTGKTIVARITGRSDPSLKGVKYGSCQGVAPPMTTVCVERHHPITQQTIGQGTAAKYPRSNQPLSGGKVTGQNAKSPTVSCGIQSIKVVD
ncbi:centrosomal protein POC5 isoform X2 [Carcharodon carcharias]|uniref:centrosomal protein POC5 isoform X2 n=1 Tax=Carcharodon carcharias TaxID=13397 RepID=UPI001B7EB62A|nr:centrosomal protein POC5 isoform X2 [Carcharodon carcharias]